MIRCRYCFSLLEMPEKKFEAVNFTDLAKLTPITQNFMKDLVGVFCWKVKCNAPYCERWSIFTEKEIAAKSI